MLRRRHYPAVRFHLSHADLVLVPQLAELQLEIRARLIQSRARSMDFSWGVAVLASPDLSSATQIGFRHFRKSSGKTLPGHVFIDRSLALGNPVAARDLRAGPLPSSTDEEELHLFVDHSIVSMMASNETAITLWSIQQPQRVVSWLSLLRVLKPKSRSKLGRWPRQLLVLVLSTPNVPK